MVNGVVFAALLSLFALNAAIAGTVCGVDKFQCKDSCVPLEVRCNRRKDCTKGEDEKNCTCVDFLSLENYVKICDGHEDCVDGSDEANCPGSCTAGEFVCSRSQSCIDEFLVCDGVANCADGEDEAYCANIHLNNSNNVLTKLHELLGESITSKTEPTARLASSLSDADSTEYSSSGYLLIRRNGIWYYTCYPKLDSPFFEDACYSLGYKELSTFKHYTRPVPSRSPAFGFIEINETAFLSAAQSELNKLTKTSGKCSSEDPLSFSCAGLQCGLAPACQPSRRRIVGGRRASLSCYPWVAAFYADGIQKCMGVILDQQWLLTAAHCFRKEHQRKQYWLARVGFSRQHSHSPHERTSVIDRVVLHPNYASNPVETNDIALVRLKDKLTFSDYVRPMCLHGDEGNMHEPEPGSECYVYGWGYKDEKQKQSVDALRQAKLKVIDVGRCNNTGVFKGKLQETHLCLSHKSGKRDACQGDSGGPLICDSANGESFLGGITSTGYGCARKQVPGIWTNLHLFRPWIKNTLNSQSGKEALRIEPYECEGFRCRLGGCIYKHFRCDYNHDCAIDGSDEQNCKYSK